MNPYLIMGEIADAAEAMPRLVGLVHRQPVGTAVPPAFIVLYPEDVVFDATHGRGSDVVNGGFVVLIGKPFERSTAELLGELAAGDGENSIKQALETYGGYTALDELVVKSIQFDVVSLGGVEYMAGVGTLEIIGEGKST